MKKIYKKPSVAIEHFILAQNIAYSCGYTDDKFFGHPTHADKQNCGWDDGLGEIYWTSTPACGGNYDPDLDVGEVCYNTPAGAAMIFAS